MNLQEYRSNLEAATAHEPTNDAVDDALEAEFKAVQKKMLERAAEKAAKGSEIDPAKVNEIVQEIVEPMRERLGEAESQLEAARKLQELLDSDSKIKARAKVLVSASSGTDPVSAALVPFYKAGTENVKRVMLLSPPSFGKTRGINALGATYDLYLAHGCSDDSEENATMLGGVLPDGKGGFMINDGKLVQAVRTAGEGFNVLLSFDEILRLSESTVAFILTFLEPRGDRYYLTTRKVDGDALEEISCETKHLHIIAAANLGAIKPVQALWSRFEQKRLKFTMEFAEQTAESVLRIHAGIDDKLMAHKYALAMHSTRRLANEGRIAFPLCFRKLVTACKVDPVNPLSYISDALEDVCTEWDSMSGDDVDDSNKALEETRKELA